MLDNTIFYVINDALVEDGYKTKILENNIRHVNGIAIIEHNGITLDASKTTTKSHKYYLIDINFETAMLIIKAVSKKTQQNVGMVSKWPTIATISLSEPDLFEKIKHVINTCPVYFEN